MTQEQPGAARITVDYGSSDRHGRSGKVFHIFDLDNREIALYQKEAIKLARNILKIAKTGGKVK